MRVMKTGNNEFHLAISEQELIIINNSLNEICHGINIHEFQTRIGASKEAVGNLLSQIHAIRDADRQK